MVALIIGAVMQELIVDPKDAGMAAHNDHPLNLNNDSKWNAFFKVSSLEWPRGKNASRIEGNAKEARFQHHQCRN